MSDLHDFLRDRASTSARTDPWVFAGRDAAIKAILLASRELPPDGKRSQTVLVQGAPGSGKTSLITHVAALLEGAGDATNNGVCMLATPPRQWPDINDIYGNVATMLAAVPHAATAPTTQDVYKIGGNILGLGGERSRAETMSPVTFTRASKIADWHRANGVRGWGPKQRVVVFVDEVQGVTPDSPASALLEDLHGQNSIPVLLVCAGLGNSEQQLARANVSRVETVLSLAALTADETVACAAATLRQGVERGVRATATDIDRWAQRIATASDGWPRHLHVYLQSAWKALLELAVPDLGKADIDAVIEHGDGARRAYYRAGIMASGCPPYVVGALHRELRSTVRMEPQDARKTIREALTQAPENEFAYWNERFANLDEGFESLLHAGVVSLDSEDMCHSPIPSFTGFILGEEPSAHRNTVHP